MKRTLSILVLVLVCCTLTSCKEIKEPKIKGDLISDSIDGNLSAEENIFTLSAGITKARVYMWIEGQDVDCENTASGTDISFNLQLQVVDANTGA